MRVGSIMGVASCSARAAISSVSVLRPLPSHKRRTLNTGRICGDPPSRGPPRSAHCLGTGRPSDVRLRFGRDVTNAAGRRGHLAVSQTEVIRDRLGHHHAYALKRRTPVRTGSSPSGLCCWCPRRWLRRLRGKVPTAPLDPAAAGKSWEESSRVASRGSPPALVRSQPRPFSLNPG